MAPDKPAQAEGLPHCRPAFPTLVAVGSVPTMLLQEGGGAQGERITCLSKHSLPVTASRRVAVLQIGRRFAVQEGVIPLVLLPSAVNSLGQCK